MPTLVISPDAVIRFLSGRAVVHTGGPQKSFSTGDTALLALLGMFSTARDEDAAVADVPESRRGAVRDAIAALKNIGALLVVERAPETGAPSAPAPREWTAATLVDTHLAPLATALHGVAGNLSGLGPTATERLAATGVSLDTRLAALLAGITSLAHELQAVRHQHLAAQLTRLGIGPDSRRLKLHVGAGTTRLDGWVNIDAYPAELSLDLRWGLPIADGAADYVFMSHTLEHLYYPDEAESVLRDLRRVLDRHGCLRVVVPDIEQCLVAYASGDDEFYRARREIWHWWPEARTRLEGFLAYAGAGPPPGAFLDSHKFGYDFDTLAALLGRVGFTRVERSSFMASTNPHLRVDDVSAVAGAMHQGKHYSLFVEARP